MRFAEFFAGIGLMRLGLERSGWECAFANDIDPKKGEMYRAQFPEDHFVLGDIRDLDPGALPRVELATASFPCTDLSLAGGRAGLAGAHSSALWPFLDLLERSDRPPLVLLENVPGFLTSHGGRDFQSALLAMNRLGYGVDAFVLDAASFVPQSRMRLFVVASRSEKASDQVENPLRPPSLVSFIRAHPEVRWTLRELPLLTSRASNLTDILEDLSEEAPEWWSSARTDYLVNQMSPRHRAVAESMIAGDTETVGTVFRRIRNGRSMAELRVDGLAGCLRTPKGGSGRQIVFMAGGGGYRARLLTPRECARLMGADDYALTVPPNRALFGFGDAVCVPVIDWIARNYLNPVLATHREPCLQP